MTPWKDDAYEDLDPEEKGPRRKRRKLGNEQEGPTAEDPECA